MKSTLMVLGPPLLGDIGSRTRDWTGVKALALGAQALVWMSLQREPVYHLVWPRSQPSSYNCKCFNSNTGLAHDGADRRGWWSSHVWGTWDGTARSHQAFETVGTAQTFTLTATQREKSSHIRIFFIVTGVLVNFHTHCKLAVFPFIVLEHF